MYGCMDPPIFLSVIGYCMKNKAKLNEIAKRHAMSDDKREQINENKVKLNEIKGMRCLTTKENN